MYSTKIRSGIAEVIESNTVVSYMPDRLDDNNNKYLPSPIPIEIDIFYSDDFLFRLHFEFYMNVAKESNASVEVKPEPETNTLKFTFKNIRNVKGPLSSSSSFYLAKGEDGSKFYVSFSAVALQFGVQLTYTIYRVGSKS